MNILAKLWNRIMWYTGCPQSGANNSQISEDKIRKLKLKITYVKIYLFTHSHLLLSDPWSGNTKVLKWNSLTICISLKKYIYILFRTVKINIWAGIMDNTVIGPILSAEILPQLLKDYHNTFMFL